MPIWKGIIIHHSATKDNNYIDDWAAITRFHTSWRLNGNILTKKQVAEYRSDLKALKGNKPPADWKWHGIVRPWRDNGYHWGLEIVKGKTVIQKGRPLTMQGAHCTGLNDTHLGICCVGNYDNDRPSDSLYYNCAQLCATMIHMFPSIMLGFIEPHRNHAQKTCPGNLFDMNRLTAYVRTMI